MEDDAGCFAKRECTGDVRSGDLAYAVADDSGGADAEGFPKRGERDLQSKDGRLCDFGLLDSRGLFVTGELRDKRPISEFAEESVAFVDLCAEGGA
jgi:hypothetical protein